MLLLVEDWLVEVEIEVEVEEEVELILVLVLVDWEVLDEVLVPIAGVEKLI